MYCYLINATMTKQLLTIVMSFLFLMNSYSQINEKKRANFWHFGNQAAVDFTCLPSSFTGSQMNAFEGSASISDTNGILQFYSEGTTVWDRNNNIMPNGTGLLGHQSSVQPAIITPHPGNPDNYFLFTTDAIWENNGVNGLRWHEIDMTLNGGLGDVVTKNNQLIDKTQEKLVAVRNATSTGYWVIVQKSNPTSTSSSNVGSNDYYAYEVTAVGVNPVPVISTTGPLVTWQSIGMYMSPQGDVMVNTHPDLNVYDFNNSTGTLTHRWAATASPFLSNFEFSPNGNLLYGCRNGEIFQLDLNAANVAAFQASQIQVSTTGVDMKALQLAPDCKLYAISSSSPTLHRIDNPNIQGVGCGFTTYSTPLISGSASFALTNFCSSFFEFPCSNRLDFDLFSTNASCTNDGSASVINLTGTTPYSFIWSTGDTTQNISSLAGGMYSVTISDVSGCSIIDSVFVGQPQTVIIDNSIITNTSTCVSNDGAIDITPLISGFGTLDTLLIDGFETDGQTTRYIANPYPGNTSTSFFFMRGDDASINFSTNPTNEEGAFYFGARRTGFSTIPTLSDVTFNPTIINGYSGLQMCALLALGRNNMNVDANTRITLEYNIDGLGWNTLMDFRQPSGFPANDLAEDTNNDGIGDGVSLTTAFQDFCYPVPATGNLIELRITTNASGSSLRQTAFDYVRLKGAPPFTYSYLWSTGDTTQDINNLTAGTYWVQITGSSGCVITDTFTVTNPCIIPVLEASFNLTGTTVCEGDSITFTDSSTGNNVFGWNWTFNGGIPASANTQGPHTVIFNTPNTYNIVLQVTDSSGTDDTTIVIIVLPKASGTANASICQGDSILLGGAFQNTAGVFVDTLFNGAANGCDSVVTTTLTVNPMEDATFSYSSLSYCQTEPNQTPTISGTNGGTFTSSPAGLSINGTTGEINFGTSSTGTYGILYTTPGAICPDTLTVFITVTLTEDASFNYSNITYCQNDIDPVANILGTAGGTFTSLPGGLSINNTTGLIDLSTSNTGTYGVLYTTPSSSCQDTLTVFLTINANDNATFNYSATNFCITDPNPIATISGIGGGIFTIDNGGNINPTTGEVNISGTGAGTFNVIYSTNGICPDSSSITITINVVLDASISPAGNYCTTDAAFNLNAVNSGGQWTGIGITNATTGTFDPGSAGVGAHQIIYSISGNCGSSDTVSITVNETPSISLTIEDDICFSKQGSIVAVVTGGALPYSYNWDNGESTPVITNLPSGNYTLFVTDSIGCSSSTFSSVEDLNNNCDFHIFLPNIFSPNGDGHNDVFRVRGEGIKSVSLIVYSRWGEKVFESNTVETSWDGNYKGEPMNTAVFVYYLSATMVNDETIEKQGNVTLVR